MAGKKKVEKEGSSWIGEVEKYSRQIWLAGLGAYSKISNDGSKLFETLVKDGEKAEKQTKVEAEKQLDNAKDTAKAAKSRVGDVKDLALGKWNELEGAFDKRLNSAISRLGVPSRNEVQALHGKVDELTRQIELLTGAKAKPVASRSTAPAKSTAKPLVKAAAKTVAKTADKVATKTAAAKPAVKKAAAKPVDAVSKAASSTADKAKSAAKPAPKKPAARKPAAKPAASASATPAASPAAAPSTPPASTPTTGQA
ncbi:phasin family protein [Pseudomonas cichorii]|uniref:phasin family protein n=1 Tax=Pseudomonas cichorii TaxID=36746 RepID=UPI001C89AF5E|nr:phasin family protein [Pseudomonas cichorii]MBX8574967.1 phasin family protein [Pseudomonas cichorii]MBX8590417.1 phasin family protein [Pseudomonas cichorii]